MPLVRLVRRVPLDRTGRPARVSQRLLPKKKITGKISHPTRVTSATQTPAVKNRAPKNPDAKSPAAETASPPSRELIFVSPKALSKPAIAFWKKSGYSGVVLLLDESFPTSLYQAAAQLLASADMSYHVWIDVGRNPRLAAEHPEWMASLGMHDDWRKRFPKVQPPRKSESAKAFPWVPIGYREPFAAHLTRVKKLLADLPSQCRGLLLNNLQAGPAACGCGNLQCRWALDYRVPSTAAQLESPAEAAGAFIAEIHRAFPKMEIVPVWTTECEEIDLPASLRKGAKSSELCGSVPCSQGLCPKEFTKQWTSLLKSHSQPIALLSTHGSLERTGPLYGAPGAWAAEPIRYIETVPPAHQGEKIPRRRLWSVVQAHDISAEESRAAREIARSSGVATVVVAEQAIDNSYEPRIIPLPAAKQ